MTILIFLAVLGLLSAVTGIQSVQSDAASGSVITYHHGLGRLLALGFAAICASGCYTIYNRKIIAWWAAWVLFFVATIDFFATAIPTLFSSSALFAGWYFAVGVTAVVCMIPVYWGYWWYKQKSYFTAERSESV